ncbi:MAG: 3-dehydroquinate synthase [Chloroflexota bacterium]|nr:MAG: 3-dehydroquinate synthase [Chloroflexota bacterium]
MTIADTATSELVVEPGVVGSLGALLRARGVTGRAFLVADSNVLRLHGAAAKHSFDAAGISVAVREVPAAESSKSLAMATRLYEWLAAERTERRDFLIALGGGVVGDLVGFVAATYLRGLPVIQVPTTLLSQVDSAIGGKTGLNLRVGKNLVGAWHMPRLIVVDPLLTRTLPERDICSGWVETIKHALLMDEELLHDLEAHADELLRVDPEWTANVVARSGRLKIAVVHEDPREQGRRIILNYGHTIGHAIESVSNYRLHHGEAVAIGLEGAGRIGVAAGVTPPAVLERQRALIARFGLPAKAHGLAMAKVRATMNLDKKVEAQTLTWVLLEAVGRPTVRRDIDEDIVQRVLEELVVA